MPMSNYAQINLDLLIWQIYAKRLIDEPIYWHQEFSIGRLTM